MTNIADLDQLASSETNWSWSTLFTKAWHIRAQQDQGSEFPVIVFPFTVCDYDGPYPSEQISLNVFIHLLSTLFTDARQDDKIRSNDNLTGTKPHWSVDS